MTSSKPHSVRNSTRAVATALLLAVLAIFLSGCAETLVQEGNSPQRNASNLPWNRPASWEGPGVYGSALGQGR